MQLALVSLLSSLLAIFLTQFTEIFKNKRSHRYDIEKMYFEKKVNAAELIFTHLSILAGSLLHASILFERLQEGDVEKDETEELVDSNLLEQLKKVDNSSLIIGNALALYFDVPEISRQRVKDFHDLLGKLGSKENAMFQAESNLRNIEVSVTYNEANKAYLAAKDNYNRHVQSIAKSYETMYDDFVGHTKLIRSDIKKYEVN